MQIQKTTEIIAHVTRWKY